MFNISSSSIAFSNNQSEFFLNANPQFQRGFRWNVDYDDDMSIQFINQQKMSVQPPIPNMFENDSILSLNDAIQLSNRFNGPLTFDQKIELILKQVTKNNHWIFIKHDLKLDSSRSVKNYFYGITRSTIRKSFRILKLKKYLKLIPKLKPKNSSKFFTDYLINSNKHNYLEQKEHIRHLLSVVCQKHTKLNFSLHEINLHALKKTVLQLFKSQ